MNQSDLKYDELIENILNEEKAQCLDSSAPFEAFKARISKERDAFMSFLTDCKKNGKTVCGLGASTKGNVLLQYYGITADLISKIGEVNTDKVGAFTPGSLIPLVSEDDLLLLNTDYLVVLPWHFRDFFENHPKFKGQKLVFPLPQFQIVEL